jgi:hypothetical protein
MQWPWERKSWANPFWPITQKAFMWPFAHTCHAGCPYCFACKDVARRVAEGERWWTDDQAALAWRNVYDRYGPCYMLMCGLEPGEQLGLMGRVLEFHYAAMATNFTFDTDEFRGLIKPDHIELHPTFHPHLWGFSAEPFAEKLAALKADGYRITLASLVAYPPYIPRLDEYVAVLKSAVHVVNVAPARACTYEGKPYPESYTEDELAVLRPHIPKTYTAKATLPPLKIERCGAGHVAACIFLNGDIGRCSQVRGMGTQNLMRDGNIEFLPEPLPCGQGTCRCAQMDAFHITEANDPEGAGQ